MLANSLADVVAEEAAKRLLPDLNLERKAKRAERIGVGVAKRLALVWKKQHARGLSSARLWVSWLTKATCSYVTTKVCFAICTEPADNSDSGVVTLASHGQAPPLSSPNSEIRKDSTSTPQQATRVMFSANLANAAKRPANMTRKNSIIALLWVIGTFRAHTQSPETSPSACFS